MFEFLSSREPSTTPQATPPARPGQVLVVDDNPATLAVVARTIQKAGLRVVCAADGAQALEAAARFRPDLVVLDVNLPDISGQEVCRRLKADASLGHILVVHLSAERTSLTDRVHGLELGADAYLTHPIAPVELLAQVRSLLRLKQAENAVRESRDLYRTLVDETPIGIAHLALDGTIVTANRHLAHMLGAEPAQFEGRNLDTLLHPDERARFRTEIETIAADGQGRLCRELRLVAADSSTVWAEILVHLHRTPEGTAHHFIAAAEDITARKAAEAALLERDHLVRELIETSSDLTVTVNASGHVTYLNRACARALGFDPASVVAQKLALFLVGDAGETWSSAFARVIAGAGDELVRLEFRTVNGGSVFVEGSLARRDETGGPVVRAVFRDVTDNRRLEQQLLRAQRLESIGTLAGGIAHDLNNVLSPILLCAGLLRSTRNDKERREYLGTIERSALRASGLVRQVLTFARGVEGERLPLHLRHVVKETVAILRETFPKTVRIINDVPVDLWLVLGNPTQLNQIVLNLCVNARDAMASGGTLTLSAHNAVLAASDVPPHPEMKPGDYVVLTVSDTGTGIPAAIRERIFEPFFTTKAPGQGTGLGLHTVLSIVRLHGGFVSIDTEEDKGTAFHVHLPAHATGSAAVAPLYAGPVFRGAGELVLVVDDERPVRNMIERTLRDNGYRVVTASDGIDAVARFMTYGSEIKVVVTDVIMPRLDGRAVSQAVRKSYPSTRVVAISGYAPQEVVEQPQSVGIDLFVAKPFSGDDLLRALHEVLSPGFIPAPRPTETPASAAPADGPPDAPADPVSPA